MKNISLFVVLSAVLTLAYQNCGGPIQDLGNTTLASVRCDSHEQGTISVQNTSGNLFTFKVNNVASAERVDWNIPSLGIREESGMTFTTNISGNFQDIPVFAAGYIAECEDARVFSATGFLSNSSCNPPLTVALNPQSVIVNNPVTVTLNADSTINTNSIRWKIGADDYPAANGSLTFAYTPTQAQFPTEGSVNISVTADFNCGSSVTTKSANSTLIVNQTATGSVQVTSFEPKPLVATGSTVRPDVFKITRNASKRLSIGLSNLASSPAPTGLPIANDANCVAGKSCFNLDQTVAAAGNAALPNCEIRDIAIIAQGTNGQNATINAFAWCYADYCHVGKIKSNAEQCCPVDTYLNQSGSCVAVTTGHYSPAGNNNQIACTNKPANSTYSGPGTDGLNNCLWQCANGYVASGDLCNQRPTIATTGSSSTCNGTTSCSITVEASYIDNKDNVYMDLRFMSGTQLPGPPSLMIPSSAITSAPLTGTHKYSFTFTITNATAISKLTSSQLAVHVVSPSNPENFRWNDPHHVIRLPSTGGGGPGNGGCNQEPGLLCP